jgi:hypothetical protein
MKLNQLFEAPRVPSGFGFESKQNAKIADAALEKAGIKVIRSSNFGIEYFDFDDEKTAKAALKIVKPLIDKNAEYEWGGRMRDKKK